MNQTEGAEIASQSVAQLIEQFEKDLQYDAHSLVTCYRRSKAREELERRGRLVLREVAQHVRGKVPKGKTELAWAWGSLLGAIERQVDPVRSGPESRFATDHWIVWAEQHAAFG